MEIANWIPFSTIMLQLYVLDELFTFYSNFYDQIRTIACIFFKVGSIGFGFH